MSETAYQENMKKPVSKIEVLRIMDASSRRLEHTGEWFDTFAQAEAWMDAHPLFDGVVYALGIAPGMRWPEGMRWSESNPQQTTQKSKKQMATEWLKNALADGLPRHCVTLKKDASEGFGIRRAILEEAFLALPGHQAFKQRGVWCWMLEQEEGKP